MTTTVTRFAPDDWRAARAARLASIRDAFGPASAFLREQAELEEAVWRKALAEHVRFGAHRGDEPVGTVCWRRESPGSGRLFGMWVHPRLRGTGVADALVDAVLAEARRHGDRTVWLKVEPGNARARAFYARAGFRERADPGPDRPGLVHMWRAVDPA